MRLNVRPTTLAVLAFLSLAACGDSPAAPSTGSLVVVAEGLPVGVRPQVRVTGPHGYDRLLALDGETASTLRSLPGGTYTIAAAAVTAGGSRFVAAPATQTVTVRDNTLVYATGIRYAVATARLTVTVLGLPAGTSPGITVSGPNGFARALTGTTSLDLLEPGSYTLAATSVTDGGRTWRASVAPRQLTLAPSTTAVTAVVAYGAGDGTLNLSITGLPAGTDAAVTLTGPNGYSRTLASSTMIEYLEPGTYTATAAVVGSSLTTHTPTPSSDTRGVVDGDTSAMAVNYASSPLALGVQLVVGEGLTQPVFVTAPEGDARLFIVERGGRIRIHADGALLPAPFLDIRARVNNNGERGMLGMAFDPNYATNGFLYAYYVATNGNMVVERFASTPGANVASGSAGIVIDIPHGGINHHGGMIAFGPDGMLYVAPGDGGCCGDPSNNAQSRNVLLGKVLRLDVRTLPYTIPPDNPYVGQASARPEIWAMGLRNPWRFSFDDAAGMLYIADVGNERREEVNVSRATTAGRNYGWRNMEGTACFNPATNCDPNGIFTAPVLEYTHAEGCSVTGGYVYRGRAIPELTGHYVYSDFCGGWLRSFRYLSGAATERRSWPGITVSQSTSFGRDGAGELYMIGGTRLWKIVRQ